MAASQEEQLNAYRLYADKYQQMKEKYTAAYEEAQRDPVRLQLWPLRGKSLQDDVDKAFDEWIALGYKDQVDGA